MKVEKNNDDIHDDNNSSYYDNEYHDIHTAVQCNFECNYFDVNLLERTS
jgi:hypothetical protein